MRFEMIRAAVAFVVLGGATASIAKGPQLPLRLATEAPHLRAGRAEQNFKLLNASQGQTSISGEITCRFYDPRGTLIGSTVTRVPALSPSEGFSGKTSITYAGTGPLSTLS